VTVALDHTHMEEGIAGPIGKLYEAESLVGIIPFDDGPDRRSGGPAGVSNLWALNCGVDPKLRRAGSKSSSSKLRRGRRKSLSLLVT
jgi:hypothetical protein